jgi:DHA2 family multidrug resistance protein-like MFS transporter
VFLVAVPVMLLLLVLGPRLLPETSAGTGQSIDGIGAGLALVAVLTAVYGLKAIAIDGLAPGPVAALALALVLAVAFVRRQRRSSNPLVDPALLRRRMFGVPVAINSAAFFVLYGTQVALAQYLQLVLGLRPLQAAFVGIPSALAYLAGSAIGPAAARRMSPAALLGVGLAVSIAGFALLAAARGGGAIAIIVAGSVVFSVGLAPVYLLTTQLAITAAPPAQAGTASAVSEAGAELGGALGMAVLGSLAVAIYQHRLAGVGPTVTPEVAEASGTLGGALAAAGQVPPDTAASLIQAARESYTQAFALTELAGAAFLALATVVAVVALLRSPALKS